jgi:hypothetical protein
MQEFLKNKSALATAARRELGGGGGLPAADMDDDVGSCLEGAWHQRRHRICRDVNFMLSAAWCCRSSCATCKFVLSGGGGLPSVDINDDVGSCLEGAWHHQLVLFVVGYQSVLFSLMSKIISGAATAATPRAGLP